MIIVSFLTIIYFNKYMQASLKQVLTKDRTVPLAARICQL